MNELLKVQQLIFTKEPHGETRVAYTPFGFYAYKKVTAGNYLVYFEFGGSQQGDLVICGDSITAQRAANMDYTNRIKEAMGLGETAEAA